MRIIGCHIDGFGKFRNVDYSFESGLNTICQNNGWGKSTLLTFIKVMLYGFDNEGKRDQVSNERAHFRPWEAEVYGGNMTVEVNNHRYIIYKTFGKKASEDVIEARDLETNFVVNGINGQDLFGVDSESFKRTLFISQDDCSFLDVAKSGKADSGISSSVSAKIGNLVDDTQDVNNFDEVMKKLNGELSKLSTSKKTGALDKINQEITEVEVSIRDKEVVERTVAELEAKRNEERGIINGLLKKRDEYSEKISVSAKSLEDKTRKENYEKLIKNEYERQDAFSELKIKFPNGIPSEEELEDITSRNESFTIEKGRLKELTFSEEDERRYTGLYNLYGMNCPSLKEIERQKQNLKDIKEAEKNIAENALSPQDYKKLEEYSDYFQENEPTEEEIDQLIESLSTATDKKSDLSQLDLQYSLLEDRYNEKSERYYRSKKQFKIMLLAAGFIFILGSILTYILLKQLLIVIPLAFIGVALIIISLLKTKAYPVSEKMTDMQNQINELQNYVDSVDNSLNNFVELHPWNYEPGQMVYSLLEMKRALQAYQFLLEQDNKNNSGQSRIVREELWEEVSGFIAGYKTYIDMDSTEAVTVLAGIEREVTEYERLSGQYKRNLEIVEECKNHKKVLQSFLMSMGFGKIDSDQFGSAIQEIKDNFTKYKAAEAECKKAEEEKKAFENDNPDFEELLQMEFGEDINLPQEISDELLRIDQEVKTHQDNENNYISNLETADERLQDIYYLESRAEYLRERKQELIKKQEIYEKTSEFLRTAKSSMTNRFSQPVMDAFAGYYRDITGNDGNEYIADANLSVTVLQAGIQRETGMLSRGQQDLLGICMRLALVNAMYTEEQPFIILDDPFTNLDGDCVRNAISLLDRLKDRYQILYFTCHESRLP